MEFTVQQIAEVLGGTVEGDAGQRITALAKIEDAQAGALTFLSNAKYEPFLYETGASAVIVSREQELRQPVGATLIRVDNPYLAFSQLLEFYAQATRTGKRGVEQPCFMGAGSTIGAGHYRGAFSYIGEQCTLGENVLIFPHAYVGDRVTIGAGSIIHAGAKIYSDTVIGQFCVVKAGAVVGSDGFGFAPQPRTVACGCQRFQNLLQESRRPYRQQLQHGPFSRQLCLRHSGPPAPVQPLRQRG